MSLEHCLPADSPDKLATDQDTRIFLVTGPLRYIIGLQEQYHPYSRTQA